MLVYDSWYRTGISQDGLYLLRTGYGVEICTHMLTLIAKRQELPVTCRFRRTGAHLSLVLQLRRKLCVRSFGGGTVYATHYLPRAVRY